MNQVGALTLDFLLALVIVMTMTFAFGLFSFTLSVIESAQYIAFASSRTYLAAHNTQKDQARLASEKYQLLLERGSVGSLLKKEWFTLSDSEEIAGDFSNIYNKQDPKSIFEGVRIEITADILGFSTPFMGSTEDGNYKTAVTSFMGREPTANECLQFESLRFQQILKLHGSYANDAISSNNYIYGMADNGC